MLFNSSEFIFYFLPLTVLVYWVLVRKQQIEWAFAVLVLASWFFYAWWNPPYLVLLIASIVFNYFVGRSIAYNASIRNSASSKRLLCFGIVANLGLLGYFKYWNFFITGLGELSGNSFEIEQIILPLAISFFTFQQIAYLVDTYRQETEEHNFLHYCLFVSFFPQLIAGPIVHHRNMLPQFRRISSRDDWPRNIVVGSTIFCLGLVKKVVIADSISPYSQLLFDSRSLEGSVTFIEAWAGALSFSFQIYFDFSGYSDMAVGLARMFGILLPINFLSPYKSRSIVEFWRTWHISLSTFLRDYLYIFLGGNRRGTLRRHINLMSTMLLGGLWHGAGFVFIVWGGVHGFYLIVNHIWRVVVRDRFAESRVFGFLSTVLTYLCVVCAWVFFRSDSMSDASAILSSMFDIGNLVLPVHYFSYLERFGLFDLYVSIGGSFGALSYFGGHFQVLWLLSLSLVVWLAPNVNQWVENYEERDAKLTSNWVLEKYKFLKWSPTFTWAGLMAICTFTVLSFLSTPSEFLYFQF